MALSGCGFRPLYAPENDVPAAAELAAIRIAPIPERRGQLLRQELERRFQARAGAAEARYVLTVSILPAADLQGFRRDGSPSRVRSTYTVPFTLSTMAVPPVPVATGSVTAFDAYNIPDQQFFAAVQSASAADRRLVEQIARDLTERLTLALQARG
ncbi:LPS assembly lipoprotein LptE [Roseomonas sp. CCTCC AB2023176]|uniref:LPS assembly lipoprotein LptE n=1 Tax=Roseomonas sp. CCTCC AB2023176 TaxID=3342640 RepID=UPI0035DF7E7D